MAGEDARQRVVNHIFLPPRLPQSDEGSTSDVPLLKIATKALVSLKESLLPASPPVALVNAIAVLEKMKAIHILPGGHPDQRTLQSCLENLPESRTLAVKVGAQNAAVLITRRENELVFEAFELSPQNWAVTSTKGRLVREFPGVAVAVHSDLLGEADFTSMVATTLCTMSQQPVSGMQPISKKAGTHHEEARDTTDPAAITEIFFGLLQGLNPTTTSVTSVSKNMRDEVLWSNAKGPWRRSAMWTLIRVTLQLTISRSPQGSRELYKEIMIYIMSFVLQSAPPSGDDMRFIMSAKISRRMRKLDSIARTLPEDVMASVHHVLEATSTNLAQNWKDVQEQDTKDMRLWSLVDLRFEQDTFVSLPALDQCIAAASSRTRNESSGRFTPTSQLKRFGKESSPVLATSNSKDPYYATANLREFEQWVSSHMNQWLINGQQVDICAELSALMKQYYDLASSHYQNNPEMQSVMVLTVFELWVACDKQAAQTCPLMAEFDADISVVALQNLVLPFSEQMERLCQVEKYLSSRKSASTSPSQHLFSMGHEGFANKYFAQSEGHKNLLAQIEADAAIARNAKLQELAAMTAEFHRLDNLHSQNQCRYTMAVVRNWRGQSETKEVHDSDCKRCSYASQRDMLRIQVHEWPLPSETCRARAVVFELRVPSWLGYWRDARSFLLQEVLKGERLRLNPHTSYLLSSNDPHLTHAYFQQSEHHRIGLLSQTKPCVNTHYGSKQIATLRESMICQPNGLKYDYCDTRSGISMGSYDYDDTVAKACTYTLSRTALQQFILRPASAPDGPPSNTILASQDECPIDMTLDEYKELVSIPLGRHIQWHNILLQLAMPGVDLKKSDTALVILQCINQTGPTGVTDSLRESHEFLSSSVNAEALVRNLTIALQRVKDNWESAQALRIFVAIAARVLSMSSCRTVRRSCLEFLSTARQIAKSWVDGLRDKAYAADKQKDRTAFVAKIVEVGLICTSTFDVDDEHIGDLLAEDAAILIKCCIVIQEGEHSQNFDTSQSIALLNSRYKRLLHRIYQRLAAPGIHNQLDSAIQQSWSGYVPSGNGWRTASGAADHWLTTDTLATAATAAMSVQYNLLNGELLANGLPLDQPPKTFRETALYSTLFRNAAVEVMPCLAPGFQFSTKRTFGDGYAVQLGMSAGVFTVKATKNGRTYETIPASALTGYPVHFERDYVHWLNVEDNIIEFRPRQSPWDTCTSGVWLLSKLEGRSEWQLANAGRSVVGLKSSTSRQISHVFETFAEPTHIHNVIQPSENGIELDIDIPAICTGFSLAQGSAHLRSREYNSMIVDCDQSLGTLVGLRSKLLLCPTKQEGPGQDRRMLLIPHSTEVHYGRHEDHAVVTVPTFSITKLHAVTIDVELGRLIDKGDIACKLHLAYLHALTSHCLVDPLTQRTGTEQALTILNGAAVRSFDHLSSAQLSMLCKLAKLSPGRGTYPLHMQLMQRVTWDNQLSCLSQHGHFTTIVDRLIAQARETDVFLPVTDRKLSYPDLLRGAAQHLLARDNIRTSVFKISGYGAEDHTTSEDLKYQARDHNVSSNRVTKVTVMSSFMFREGVELAGLQITPGQLWRALVSSGRMEGPGAVVEAQDKAKYHADLLRTGHDDLTKNFPALHRWLSGSDARTRRYSLMMWLSTLASTGTTDDALLQVVGLFIKSSSCASIQAPDESYFTPAAGAECSTHDLRLILSRYRKPISDCPEASIVRGRNEKLHKYNSRRDSAWRQAGDAVISDFANALSGQWPREAPVTPQVNLQSTYINVSSAMEEVGKQFKTWHNNMRLSEYLSEIERTVATFGVRDIEARAPTRNVAAAPDASRTPGHISDHDLLSNLPPKLTAPCRSLKLTAPQQCGLIDFAEPLLTTLVKTLEASLAQSRFGKKYVGGLSESLNALQTRENGQLSIGASNNAADIQAYFNRCEQHVQTVYTELKHAVELARGDTPRIHSPRVSPAFFLEQLARNRWGTLSPGWKECIVHYGLALTAFQRAGRLLKSSDHSRLHDLAAELSNPGHRNWDPMDFPESLLIEVESGIMIRDVQEYIAAQMRSPPNGDNAVMQLNMGEGKSSVIVPITAAALAGSTGDQLVRVIVAKAQSKQMQQMLISKLGGLVNRRIHYMPFSRSLKLNEAGARTICKILRDCMMGGGILLVQPEHILSFQLMALECYITGKQGVGQQLLSVDVQSMLDSARDIVDESDENFSVHFELIYTMGSQSSIELSPDRWILVQQVLDIVRDVAPAVSQQLPGSVEWHSGSVAGTFPRLRTLRQDAEEMLLHKVADYLCEHGLHGLQISRQPEATRKAIHTYITKSQLSAAEIDVVEQSVFWTDATKSPLLLLRGCIAGGVLAFVFGQKRWRVNYGLTTVPRTPPTKLAVPYRGKDCPSPRSEFSHPDVVLMLTSLCYCYGGLSDPDLFTAFAHVMDSDQSDIEYQQWVKDAHTLPLGFQQLQGVNLKDRLQCTQELFPALRYAKSVVDYFLSHIVFPKEMKEFPLKLSASGWDMGRSKKLSGGAVTGFSGTNDSQCLLPLDVGHLDLPEQKHTNALVLEHILQPENGVIFLRPRLDHQISDAEHLLCTAMTLNPPVQVILDVGAQILEMNNVEVAKTWLEKHDSSKEAAVFVNDNDEICVVDRNGREELLRTSSFSNRLGACLIFLDEAHTRGIDLQLPLHYRAAVTLGAGLTKDRLVQAAMRMRKLGKGQTVVFCISPEIRAKIEEVTSKNEFSDITTADVLHWAIWESNKDIRRSMPLWAVQGERFVRQDTLWQVSKAQMSGSLAQKFREAEARSIDERYRPRLQNSQPTHLLESFDDTLQRIAERCRQFDDLELNSSTLQEEQERELSPEIEQERQVQRPPAASPAKHILHPDVRIFATCGIYLKTSTGYRPAFQALQDSSAAKDFRTSHLDKDQMLLATTDFIRTVESSGNSFVSDNYQRAVQWLLTCRVPGGDRVGRIMIISPFEANVLIQSMKDSHGATLHLYKPRSNSGYAPLDHLLFHTVSATAPPIVPRALVIRLNLFAGQLYVSSHEDYLEICRFLGLSTKAVTQEMAQQGWQQDATGFILRDEQGNVGGESGLPQSPVQFFQVLMSKIRRNGEAIVKTHMGGLLEGKPYQEGDF